MDERGRAKALATAHAATETAQALRASVTPEEQALIAALPARFPQADLAPLEEMTGWHDAFAGAMREVQARFPASREVRSVTVEAMMQRTPWAMWDLTSGAPAQGADTLACKELLEAAFRDDPEAWRHPGLLHLYVHLMEMSATPEAALRQADVLRTLVPDAGIWCICRPISMCSAGPIAM